MTAATLERQVFQAATGGEHLGRHLVQGEASGIKHLGGYQQAAWPLSPSRCYWRCRRKRRPGGQKFYQKDLKDNNPRSSSLKFPPRVCWRTEVVLKVKENWRGRWKITKVVRIPFCQFPQDIVLRLSLLVRQTTRKVHTHTHTNF